MPQPAPTERIDALADRASRARERFEPPADPPDRERAVEFVREGLGPTVWVYVEGRTGGRMWEFSEAEFDRLQSTMNTWLELYAACYGADIEAEFTVREAAELLLDTHDARDVAHLLTHVPDREQYRTASES